MEQAEQICDHIFLINDGRKVLDGRLEEIVENYPVDSVRVSGEFEARTFESIPAVESAQRNGNEMVVRLKEDFVAQDLLLELVKRGRVDRFAAARPPLSEIFIREVEASRE
jgi:ABC-2 type transport system ATP-binding protein